MSKKTTVKQKENNSLLSETPLSSEQSANAVGGENCICCADENGEIRGLQPLKMPDYAQFTPIPENEA